MKCLIESVCGITRPLGRLSPIFRKVAHVLRTRSPLSLQRCCHRMNFVRLACIKHAASVRPEPGSNSPSRSHGTDKRSRFDLESR